MVAQFPPTHDYIGQYNVGDDETGKFNHFFRDDGMNATYHIELRYGSDLDELQVIFSIKSKGCHMRQPFDSSAYLKTISTLDRNIF
ncbi:unknown [Eubacterium sp. CAG:786]|nr:unknown [Eubacterium sp. CAG:786]